MLGIVKKELVFIGIVFLMFILGWTMYDNYNYFNNIQLIPQAHGATGNTSASLSVRVGESITFTIDAGGDINFGTLTAGTPVTSTTRLKTTTNSGDGFSFTAAKWSYITSPQTTFYSRANHTLTVSDTGTGRSTNNAFDGLSSCTAGPAPSVWATGSSTGFGLTIYSAGVSRALSTSPKNTTCWGGHDAGQVDHAGNKYAYVVNSGAAPSSVFSSTGFSNSAMYVSVGYILDVDSTQSGTQYQAAIEFIATSNP